MSTSVFSLQQFVQTVPICAPTATLDSLKSIFLSGQNDAIVVVSEHQAPLGILKLKAMMPHLLRCLPVYSGLGGPSYNPDCEIDPLDLRSLIEPVAILPSQMNVRDFLPYLQAGRLGAQAAQTCALVDPEGKFIGLLDSLQLLQSQFSHDRDFENIHLPFASSISWSALLQLLDKLPIPLMLQTDRGEVRHQNLIWRKEIGEEGQTTSPEHWSGSHFVSAWCNLVQDEEDRSDRSSIFSQTEGFEGETFNAQTAIGKSGATYGTIWQFVKFPLNLSGDWGSGLGIDEIAHFQSPLWLILATDITEQHQLCKELAAKNADLVQLNRLKDEFLACISHELKTPLTAVLGLSSLLKDRKLGELTQRQARYAQLIHQSGQQLMSVVNDLLDLTRIEAGQLKLTFDLVRVRAVCDRAYQQAIAQQSAKDERHKTLPVRFTLEIEPGLETIVADELRLRQMLLHLLDNALKFTPAGGKMGLKVSRWEGWIEFTVWDTGIGIPEASQHLIFQKFQQLESPLTRQFEGTGLGLVLTQRLARAHGGEISFISKVNRGSQFTLLLPPSPPDWDAMGIEGEGEDLPLSSPIALPDTSFAAWNHLVLIVEAVPRSIERLNDRLQQLGYRVAIARSGTEALEKARQLKPRAIFLNPLLPLLSGWDVLTLLKADEKTQSIPTIVMATWAEKERAKLNQADGFLSLPIEKPALQEALYNLGERFAQNPRKLTLLHLNPEGHHLDAGENAVFSTHLDAALNSSSSNLNYRIVATDDLEQADTLSRVWQPNVLLIDAASSIDPSSYLKDLKTHKHLACLPIVALDPAIAESANQIGGLAVFPCLVPINRHQIAPLLQAIQIAANMSSQPHILAIGDCELETPEENGTQENFQDLERQGNSGEPELLKAFVQYLQTAGLKSHLTHSWSEVQHKIQHHGVNLLCIYLGRHSSPHLNPTLLQELQKLAQLPMKPPILIIDRRDSPDPDSPTPKEASNPETQLLSLFKEVSTKVLRGHSYSCTDLLEYIHQILSGQVELEQYNH
ncbi:ATP-binding response regulator [Lusitaniella coriacea]|uniref:ATP-binding response regulator n=1 Tax=Lusitaniella coriacea TaxID=1983105 RepID=UPI003CF64A01